MPCDNFIYENSCYRLSFLIFKRKCFYPFSEVIGENYNVFVPCIRECKLKNINTKFIEWLIKICNNFQMSSICWWIFRTGTCFARFHVIYCVAVTILPIKSIAEFKSSFHPNELLYNYHDKALKNLRE